MVNIPGVLKVDCFRFIKVAGGAKRAIEESWQKASNYAFGDDALAKHIAQGGNYGVLTGVGGISVLDLDDKDAISKISPKLKTTTRTIRVVSE